MRFLLTLLTLVFLHGCADSTDRYSRALAIERQLLRQDKDADYGHSGYVQVLRELKAVPRSSTDRSRADALAQRIRDGRRFALLEAMPQVDHLPRRLEGREAPQPLRRNRKPKPKRDQTHPAAAAAFKDLDEAQLATLDITLYSTVWCGYCKKARSWLRSSGLPYVEKDIEKDDGARREYQEAGKGYTGVPLIVVNGQPLRGFSRPAVEQAVLKATGG